jgi:hypothetical protein
MLSKTTWNFVTIQACPLLNPVEKEEEKSPVYSNLKFTITQVMLGILQNDLISS